MKFRKGDYVNVCALVEFDQEAGNADVFVRAAGDRAVTLIVPASECSLLIREYRVGDWIEAKSGQPAGPHKVLGVNEGMVWTVDQHGAHIVHVANTIQPCQPPEAEELLHWYMTTPGETYASIAARFGIDADEIRRLNFVTDIDLSHAPVKLRMPPGFSAGDTNAEAVST